MQTEKKSMGNKETGAVKSIINMNKYWGIILKMNLTEIEEQVTYKGYIDGIEYKKEYGKTPIANVVFTDSSKGELNKILGITGSTYKWFFPIYKLQYDIDELSASMIQNSGGYLEDVQFVEFESKGEMIMWALDSSIEEGDGGS